MEYFTLKEEDAYREGRRDAEYGHRNYKYDEYAWDGPSKAYHDAQREYKGSKRDEICSFDSRNNPMNENEALSNAKLIAAAPDLLKALQNLMDYPEKDLIEWASKTQNVTMTFASSQINDAIKAIKKATT